MSTAPQTASQTDEQHLSDIGYMNDLIKAFCKPIESY